MAANMNSLDMCSLLHISCIIVYTWIVQAVKLLGLCVIYKMETVSLSAQYSIEPNISFDLCS